MNRKIERNLLRVSAVWDVLIGLVTMFGYYPWFEEQGASLLFKIKISMNICNQAL